MRRAPSWSWAAIDGPVLFSDPLTNSLEPGHRKSQLDDIEMKVELLGNDPHGRVCSGTLTATGWLVPVQLLTSDVGSWEQWSISQWARWISRRRYFTQFYEVLIGYDHVQAPDMDISGAAAFDEPLESSDGLQALVMSIVSSCCLLFQLWPTTARTDGLVWAIW